MKDEPEDAMDWICQRIESWPYSDYPGFLKFVKRHYDHNYGRIRKHEEHGIIEFVTGGWSDNESILSAMHKNYLLNRFWLASFGGGREDWQLEQNVVPEGQYDFVPYPE